MNDVDIIDGQITSNRIKPLLKKKGMAQEEAARRSDVSYRHFNRVTLRKAEPTLIVAKKIALVLDATVDEVFTVKLKTRRARSKEAS